MSLIYQDLLDEFSASKIDGKGDAPTSSGPGRPETKDELQDTTDEFTKQLQEQMASLMGEIDESPEMRQQIEAMMKELTGPADPMSQPQSEAKPIDGGTKGGAVLSNTDDSFQEKIRKTMERMQASGEQATAAATEGPDDILAQMLKDMQGAGLDGAGGEEDFSNMLMGMMAQLTNKEILYEPMKELHEKFPGWMANNKESAKADDLRRYEEQQRLVGEIVGRFEKRDYSDENTSDREFIVERMQKVRNQLLFSSPIRRY